MARVSITKQAHKPLEIDLWAETDGAMFETQAQTKTRVDELEPLRKRLIDVAALSADEQLDLIGEYLDLALKPKNGSRKKPSALVKAKWDAGEVDVDQVASVFEAVLTGQTPS